MVTSFTRLPWRTGLPSTFQTRGTRGLSVWSSGPVTPPGDDSEIFEVALYARLRSAEVRPIYEFRYARRKDRTPGSGYLLGKGEPWWQRNVGIIYRQGQYGKWHPAAPEWGPGFRWPLLSNAKALDAEDPFPHIDQLPSGGSSGSLHPSETGPA